jgi:hypothetical protein
VTGVKLETTDSSVVQLGNVGFNTGYTVKTQYIQSLVDFELYAGIDPKAAMKGQGQWVPEVNNDITYGHFYFRMATLPILHAWLISQRQFCLPRPDPSRNKPWAPGQILSK